MKIFATCTLATLVVLTTGCSDFLNQKLTGQYSSATFYQSAQDAQLALTGIYNAATFTNTRNNLWVFGDVASDDAVKGGAPGDIPDITAIDQYTYVTTNTILDNMWRYYYEGVARADYLLYYAPNINMDATLKAQFIGEAKFLRAYFYFNLVNIYGSIPLKLLPPLTLAEINVAKSPVADIYAQIESDLKDAAGSLPAVYTDASVGRATSGAAYGLLAKMYVYNARWTDALDAIASLESGASYALTANYQDSFVDSTQNNVESVFEIQHLRAQQPLEGSFLNQYFQPSVYNGYYFDAPLTDFVKAFEITVDSVVDPRLDFTIGRAGHLWVNGEPFDSTWSSTGFLQRKNVQPTRTAPIIGDAGLNYVYMRYADILLLKAEALNESSRGAEAIVPLNLVRARARNNYSGDIPAPDLLPDVTYLNADQLRTAIRHERRVELGFEFHRWFDLMRYGKDVANAALGSTGFDYDKNRYFSIPQSEIDTNSALQNQ